MTDPIADLESYFQELGIQQYKNILQFWSALDQEYGMTRARQLESAYIKLADGDEASFYSTIFEEYDVGIAFACLRISLYRSFMQWFQTFLNDEPGTIIDIGCGNGVLACFIARQLPNSKVTGFDICHEGIDSAKILKKRLKLENIEFIQGDYKSIKETYPDLKGDIVFSIASIDPLAGGFDNPENMSLNQIFNATEKDNEPEPLDQACDLLKDENSNFISFDKVESLKQQVRRISSIEKCGLSIDYSKSRWLTYENIESEGITLPALVASIKKEKNSYDQSIGFLLNKNFKSIKLGLEEKQDLEAELTFTYINPKEFVLGARADYKDGTGSIWHEVWKAGAIVLSFEHSNHGWRGLTIETIDHLERAKENHYQWVKQSESYAQITNLDKPEIEFSPLTECKTLN